jgi:hypothetical protein
MGLRDRFRRRRGPALTNEQRARLDRIVNPQQRQALLESIANGEDIPDYAWTPIPEDLDPRALVAGIRDEFKEWSARRIKQELVEAADALRPHTTADPSYLASPRECPMATMATRFVPLMGWGIFNPFGPTVSYLALIEVPDRDEQLLLQRMQHPMTEDAVVVGLLPTALAASATGLLPTLHRLFGANGTPEHPLVGGSLPTHVVLPPGSPLVVDQVKELFWLVASRVSDGADLDAATAELLRHKGSPWERTSQAVRAALERVGHTRAKENEPGSNQDPVASARPSREQFARWWAAATDPEHVRSELEALPSAWEGAEEFVERVGRARRG